jgi:hypothetical protein
VQAVAVEGGRDELTGSAVHPVHRVGRFAAGQRGSAVLERQRDYLRLAAGAQLEGVGEGRLQQPVGRNAALGSLLLVLVGAFEGPGRNLLVSIGPDAVDGLPDGAVVPVVADDTVIGGHAAGDNGGVSGRGDGVRVGVMAVREPRAVRGDPLEPALAELRLPALQVVAAELVEVHEDNEPWARGFVGRVAGGREQENGQDDREEGERSHARNLRVTARTDSL